MLGQFNLFNTMILAAADLPNPSVFLKPLVGVINLVLYILCGILVGLTGVKMVMSSIAMATAVSPEEKNQKRDEWLKTLKNFIITGAATATLLIGGPLIMDWVTSQMKAAPTSIVVVT